MSADLALESSAGPVDAGLEPLKLSSSFSIDDLWYGVVPLIKLDRLGRAGKGSIAKGVVAEARGAVIWSSSQLNGSW